MDTWKVLSISEDHRLRHTLNKLRRWMADIVGLSGTRIPGLARLVRRSYNYYMCSTEDGTRLRIAVAEVIPADLLIRVRLKHILCFISFIVMYAFTEVCKADEREIFCDNFNPILDG